MTDVQSSTLTEARGRYLVRNPLARVALTTADAVLARIVARKSASAVEQPKRLLVAVGGHLGDAVIATSVLPLIVRRFPDVELGMLVPSWSADVVRGHPALRHLHTIDHWKANRGRMSTARKVIHWRRSLRAAEAGLRCARYDAAIDLYPFFENGAYVLWRAGIPVRIGYRSGGLGTLFTHRLEWTHHEQHAVVGHLTLLAVLDPELGKEDPGLLTYDLPPIPANAEACAASLRNAHALEINRYIVLHPGTGAAHKRWPTERWLEVARRLLANGERVVLTGAGAADGKVADDMASREPRLVNLCDRLGWDAFRATIAAARLAIGVDSVAMHVAAAHRRPCVTVMTGSDDSVSWHPLGSSNRTVPGSATADDVVHAVAQLNESAESAAAC